MYTCHHIYPLSNHPFHSISLVIESVVIGIEVHKHEIDLTPIDVFPFPHAFIDECQPQIALLLFHEQPPEQTYHSAVILLLRLLRRLVIFTARIQHR